MAGNNQVGSTVGGITGGLAGGALLGMLDGPLPFGEMIGGAIGGKIGETIGSYMPKMRMAGDIFKKGLVYALIWILYDELSYELIIKSLNIWLKESKPPVVITETVKLIF